MPIKTGYYFIINAETRNLAYLPYSHSGEPIQARYPEGSHGKQSWKIRDRKNGHHSIVNIRHKQYAASGNLSKVGDPVHGWERDQTWHIQKTRVKGQYTISTTDSRYFWGLVDNQQGTPITLADVPTDRRNWWIFQNVNTGKDAEVNPGYVTAASDMILHAQEVRQILSQSPYVVLDAIHDSGQQYPPSECYPGTREDILKIMLDWVNKPLEESESQIFWLSGPVGVGKTAIAQTLCQRLKELGRLGGDVFLSRPPSAHNDFHTLFPTLAYQLALTYPEFGHILHTIIKNDESILTKNIKQQLKQLIVNPLKQMDNALDIPPVVVIDGLDEAGGEDDQTSLLRLLGLNFLKHRLPLKIVLTSRPEPGITRAFADTPLLGRSRCHFLHHTQQTDDDIRTVLISGFHNIRNYHDLMKMKRHSESSDSWPSSYAITDIVDRASGQFIYVSTILKYIGDPNGDPNERLQMINKLSLNRTHKPIDSPFLALDKLYKHVLSTSSVIDYTLAVLGIIVAGFATSSFHPYRRVLRTWHTSLKCSTVSFSLGWIERILDLQQGDVLLAVRTIQSVVDISSDGEDVVKFYHKSFQDFLLDSSRAGEYFIDINQIYTKLMMWAFRFLRNSESKRVQYFDFIGEQFLVWWLRAAASDENRLLREIKAIDLIVFYRNYVGNVARKVPLLSNVLSRIDNGVEPSLLKNHCKHGNIAESISLKINNARQGTGNFDFSLERFNAGLAVAKIHLNCYDRPSQLVATKSNPDYLIM